MILVFFCAVALLLVRGAREVEWANVAEAIRGYSAATLMMAVGLAVFGHLLYTTYDLLAARYTGHELRRSRVMGIAFVSYTFNLNLGALIGALGFRFRLYSRFGLGSGTISRILGFSIVSNWLGYLLLGGVVLSLRIVELPPAWPIGDGVLQVVGIGMILVVAFYVTLCASSNRRSFRIRDVEVELPPLGTAMLQLALSCGCWSVMGMALFVLLNQQIPPATVLGVLLMAAVAALVTHIPAGLGVLEATFVLMLGHLLPRADLLAAVLAYRAIYYLVPLVLAILMLFWLESHARRP